MTNPTTTDSPGGEFLVTTRRTFHLAAIYVLGALISLALAIPTLIYLLVPPKGRKQSGFIDAGDISQLTPGEPVELSFQQEPPRWLEARDGKEDGLGSEGSR